MVRALSRKWSHPLLRELAEGVDLLHRLAHRLEKDEG
jgi:hypothetical protein